MCSMVCNYCVLLYLYLDSLHEKVHDHVKMNNIIAEVSDLCKCACFDAVVMLL